MKFLLKYGYEFGMNSGPQGEMGFTKTYYHNNSEVLWVTINPNTYKVHFYNKYDCGCSPFDEAKNKYEAKIIIQEYENGKDATFALYTDGDKYKNILETVDFPLYVG